MADPCDSLVLFVTRQFANDEYRDLDLAIVGKLLEYEPLCPYRLMLTADDICGKLVSSKLALITRIVSARLANSSPLIQNHIICAHEYTGERYYFVDFRQFITYAWTLFRICQCAAREESRNSISMWCATCCKNVRNGEWHIEDGTFICLCHSKITPSRSDTTNTFAFMNAFKKTLLETQQSPAIEFVMPFDESGRCILESVFHTRMNAESIPRATAVTPPPPEEHDKDMLSWFDDVEDEEGESRCQSLSNHEMLHLIQNELDDEARATLGDISADNLRNMDDITRKLLEDRVWGLLAQKE